MSADHRLLDHAHAMRRAPTEPEKRLWRQLSNAQLGGHKFRRQAVIGRWIVDFLCPAKALVLEIDGDTHDAARDATRDALLARAGYRTLRFTNAEVIGNMDGVLTTILEALASTPDRWPGRERVHHPNPSSEEEGLGVGLGEPEAPSSARKRIRVGPAQPETPSSSAEGLCVGPDQPESPSSSEEGFGVAPSSSFPSPLPC